MTRYTLAGLRDAAVFTACLACAFAAASIDDPAPAVALAPCSGDQAPQAMPTPCRGIGDPHFVKAGGPCAAGTH